jgi:hypothetical protein
MYVLWKSMPPEVEMAPGLGSAGSCAAVPADDEASGVACAKAMPVNANEAKKSNDADNEQRRTRDN